MTHVLHIGLGRTGLPQALVAADSGFEVYGTDVNDELMAQLEGGACPFQEPLMAELLERHIHGSFIPVRMEGLGKVVPRCDYAVLAVNLRYDGLTMSPKLDNLVSSADLIFRHDIKRGLVVILRSTMPLGTTDRLKAILGEKYKKMEGKDFHLAFVPERLVEGRAVSEERTITKILSAYSDEGMRRLEALYSRIGGKLVRVSTPKVAELAKLTDNSFRSTIFSFANDLALVAERNGIDVLEVITACNESYPRNAIPLPGPVSGTCLGKDPYILELAAGMKEKRGFGSLWYYGRKANDGLADHVVGSLVGELRRCGHDSDARVLVLGLSYRENVDDFRMSHAIDIVRRLVAEAPAFEVSVYDPGIDRSMYSRLPEELEKVVRNKYVELSPQVFRGVNAVVITDRHEELVAAGRLRNLRQMLRYRETPFVIYDCWNIWREAGRLDGVVYRALGYGVRED
ncbi:MAG: nucleotide sugar dehydrogenase [Chloroflexota bacterium]